MSDTVFCGHVEIVDPMARRCVDAIWRGNPDDLIEARTMLDGMLERALEKQAQEDAQRTHYDSQPPVSSEESVSADEMTESITRCASRIRNKGCMTFGRGEA